MTITMTTQSEPIGIRHTSMDITFTLKGLSRVIIKALTPEGYKWIRQNMDHAEDFTVTVDREYEEELKEQMRKDGLNI